MLYKEIVSVLIRPTQNTITPCGQYVELLNVKLVVLIVTTVLEMVKSGL
jgi:hypothetical protein